MAGRKTAGNSKPNADSADVSFETALAELEEIVAAMEEEQLPLEELVARYEKGSKLLARCETVLASARKRLEILAAGTTGSSGTPGDEDEDDDILPAAPDEHDDDDDIRLF